MYGAFDLSDNLLTRLENFPPLPRLRTLLLCNNRLTSIAADFATAVPFLDALVLTNNRLSTLAEIDALAPLRALTVLVLLGNPVTRRENYRSFCVARLPALHLLDGQRVTQKERADATKWARSKKGRAFIADVTAAAAAAATAVANVAAGGDAGVGGALGGVGFSAAAAGLDRAVKVSAPPSGGAGGGGSGVSALSAELRARLVAATAAASSIAEVDAIEAALKRGAAALEVHLTEFERSKQLLQEPAKECAVEAHAIDGDDMET